MTRFDHQCIQRQFVEQVALRLGVPCQDPSNHEQLVRAIEAADPRAHELLQELQDAYRKWFEATTAAIEHAGDTEEAVRLREEALRLNELRDRCRRALVNYLDETYLSSRHRENEPAHSRLSGSVG